MNVMSSLNLANWGVASYLRADMRDGFYKTRRARAPKGILGCLFMFKLASIKHHWIQVYVLLPLVTAVVLAVAWAQTFRDIQREEIRGSEEAIESTQRLLDTYEAQFLRAINDIKLSLNLIEYADSVAGGMGTLAQLHDRKLLLTDLLFQTTVIDSKGKTLATSPVGQEPVPVSEEMLHFHLKHDGVFVSGPFRSSPGMDPLISMSRRINARGHIAVITMPFSYLVSGYDESRFGKDGVMGVLNDNGTFLVLRTGAALSSGQSTDKARLFPAGDGQDARPVLSVSDWDGVPRYMAARRVYDVPLAVVVALPEQERLAGVRSDARSRWRRLALASALAGLAALALAWQSWRVAVLRQREALARAEHDKQVAFFAFHDGLTGLLNRRAFNQRLADCFGGGAMSELGLGLMFLDLDGFKKINDVRGHAAGDELLKQVAQRLVACVGSAHVVARLGGDEFVVLLLGASEKALVTPLASAIVSSLARPYLLFGEEARVTVSLGISLHPGDGQNQEQLLNHADDAMYRAKQLGKNRFEFFECELECAN